MILKILGGASNFIKIDNIYNITSTETDNFTEFIANKINKNIL
jgi:hypothetical protein